MKLLFPSNTSTAAVTAAAVLLPAFTFGYNMGGGGYVFGRPIFITPNTVGPRCVSPPFSSSTNEPQGRNCRVDSAFENLESEMNADKNNGFSSGSFRRGGSGSRRSDFRRRGPGGANNDVNIDQETVEALRQQRAQQQELFNQALDLANDVVNGITSGEDDSATTLREKQKMWFNRAFDMIAPDVATASPETRSRSSAAFSPRFEMINNDEKFQILVDIPGVKPSNIDIRLVDDDDEKRSSSNNNKVLIIQGQRESRIDGNAPPVEFKKEFLVDASVIDVDSIAAQIDNGVLVVTATKLPPPPAKKDPAQRKIPVTQVVAGTGSDDQTASVSVVAEDDSMKDNEAADSSNETADVKSTRTAGDEKEEEEKST